jgi:hypothetical protein
MFKTPAQVQALTEEELWQELQAMLKIRDGIGYLIGFILTCRQKFPSGKGEIKFDDPEIKVMFADWLKSDSRVSHVKIDDKDVQHGTPTPSGL